MSDSSIFDNIAVGRVVTLRNGWEGVIEDFHFDPPSEEDSRVVFRRSDLETEGVPRPELGK